MLSKRTTEALDKMIGKTFDYGGHIHYMVTYTDDDEKELVSIKTNLDQFTRPYESLGEFLKYWKAITKVSNTSVVVSQDLDVVKNAKEITNRAERLIKLLEENIEKVQTNPAYIPQATCINKNISSIISIENLRMELLNTNRKK